MYFLYQCIHLYKFKIDEVVRILSFCKCSVLCYILEYSYIVQKGKGHVFAFNMQTPDQVARMLGRVLHVESKHITCASLCYLHNIAVFNYVTQTTQDKLRPTSSFSNLFKCIHWYKKYMYT